MKYREMMRTGRWFNWLKYLLPPSLAHPGRPISHTRPAIISGREIYRQRLRQLPGSWNALLVFSHLAASLSSPSSIPRLPPCQKAANSISSLPTAAILDEPFRQDFQWWATSSSHCRLLAIFLFTIMRSQPHYRSSQTGKFIAMDIHDPFINFQALAQAMGMPAQYIAEPEAIAESVHQAIDSQAPNLIEIAIGTE